MKVDEKSATALQFILIALALFASQLKMLNPTGWMNGLIETIICCADLMSLCLIPCAKYGGNARNVVICTRCLQK